MILFQFQLPRALVLLLFLTGAIAGVSNVQDPATTVTSTRPEDIDFLLFSDKSNPTAFEVLNYQNLTSVTSSSYDPSKPTKFLVHGFNDNRNGTFPQNVKNAYLKNPAIQNVIVMDWGKLAKPVLSIDYPKAVKNVVTAGTQLGNFIVWLRNNSLIDLDKTHLVGFSLGAHVSGRAGFTILTALDEPVARITGLDPAGPAFYTGLFARRLQPSDATYVDAYHSDIFLAGNPNQVGLSDIFLNGGGGPQPGCNMITDLNGCSHVYATKFFAHTVGTTEAVRPEDDGLCASRTQAAYWFANKKCDKKIRVGEYATLKTATFGMSYVAYNVSFT